jgi:hypothetical protein
MRLTSACCRKTILQVISLYVPELNHQALCEEAIVLFKEVGLAYKVGVRRPKPQA